MSRCTHKGLTWLCLVSVFFICFYADAFAELPKNYQDSTAGEKQAILWDNVSDSYIEHGIPDANQSSWSDAIKKIRAFFSLGKTFDTVSDELPEGRAKFIHTNGSVGKIRFIPTAEHPFTGIYQTGGIGLARLSLAINPEKASFTPGMALKFLVDGSPSLNIVAMYSLEGQKDNWNYFAHDFTTKIDHAKSLLLKPLEWIFTCVRNPANDLPVSHLANVDCQGKLVQQPNSPEMLTFKPADNVKTLISPESRVDFRKSLESIPSFGPLYEVYGQQNGHEYHVGTIQLESHLIASEYGDKHLFFQHKR